MLMVVTILSRFVNCEISALFQCTICLKIQGEKVISRASKRNRLMNVLAHIIASSSPPGIRSAVSLRPVPSMHCCEWAVFCCSLTAAAAAANALSWGEISSLWAIGWEWISVQPRHAPLWDGLQNTICRRGLAAIRGALESRIERLVVGCCVWEGISHRCAPGWAVTHAGCGCVYSGEGGGIQYSSSLTRHCKPHIECDNSYLFQFKG